MRTTKTRLLSLVLAVMMLVSMLSTVVLAGETIETEPNETPVISPTPRTTTVTLPADLPTGTVAWNDKNGNGLYEEGEAYTALETALTAVGANQTIVLVDNYNYSTSGKNSVLIPAASQNVTVNLNGKTLTAKGYAFTTASTVTIKNGTLNCETASKTLFSIGSGSTVTLENMTITNLGAANNSNYAIVFTAGSATLNLENCTVKATGNNAIHMVDAAQTLNITTSHITTTKEGAYAIGSKAAATVNFLDAASTLNYVTSGNAYSAALTVNPYTGHDLVEASNATTGGYTMSMVASGTDVEPEAAIGETSYETLKEALAAAEANNAGNSTVKLLKNVSLTPSSAYAFGLNNSMTLDLNGYILTSSAGVIRYGNTTDVETNTLTIVDSSADNTGKIVSTGTDRNTLCMVRGNLVMTNVHIETETANTCITANGTYSTPSTFTITGGSLTGGASAVIRLPANSNINATITGTTISAADGVEPLEINTAEGYGVTLGAGTVINYTTEAYTTGTGTVAAAAGCTATTTGDDTNGYVTTIAESMYEAAIGETSYETLKDALAAAEANTEGNSTVKLLKNVSLTPSSAYAFGLNNSMTLDLNGFTLTSSAGVIRYGNGATAAATNTLTIKDSSEGNTGKIVSTSETRNVLCMILGNLVMTNVHIETETGNTCISTTNSKYSTASGTFTITGGSLTGGANAVISLISDSQINVTITGTTITAADGVEPLSINTAEGYGVTLGAGTVINHTTEGYTTGTGTVAAADGCTATTTGDDTNGWTTTVAVASTKFDFFGANVIAGNNLDMMFAFRKDAADFDADCYVVLEKTVAGGQPTTETISFANWGTSGNYYTVTKGLVAKEMTDVITLTVYNGDDVAISNPWEDSMRAYAMRKLDTASNVAKTTFVDMLNYGAAVQTSLGYATNDLANALLTAEQQAFASAAPDFSDKSNKVELGNSKWYGSNLIVESNIQYMMAFKGVTEGMYVTVEYTDHYGADMSETYTYNELGTSGSYKTVTIETLVIADARQIMTVTVFNADGSEYVKCTESIESYLARMSATEDPVFEAVMKFADSAKTLLHS